VCISISLNYFLDDVLAFLASWTLSSLVVSSSSSHLHFLRHLDLSFAPCTSPLSCTKLPGLCPGEPPSYSYQTSTDVYSIYISRERDVVFDTIVVGLVRERRGLMKGFRQGAALPRLQLIVYCLLYMME
jgi:hypothetical protein